MSRFTDHLGLTPLEDEIGRPIPTEDGRTQWSVLPPPMSYEVGAEGSGERITVAAGATTDLGSIPRLIWSLGFSPDGVGAKAYVLHDFLYRTRGTCLWRGDCYRTRALAYSRAEADAILKEALAVLGVPAWKRQVIWLAVRVGGSGGWGS